LCDACATFCHEGHNVLYAGKIKFSCNCDLPAFKNQEDISRCLVTENEEKYLIKKIDQKLDEKYLKIF